MKGDAVDSSQGGGRGGVRGGFRRVALWMVGLIVYTAALLLLARLLHWLSLRQILALAY